jgi:KDO2-lipid IV(A) lauroyltransferase
LSSPFASGPGPAAVYFAFRIGAWLAEHTPRPIVYAVAHAGARVAYRFVERKRTVVEKNLARVVGAGSHVDGLVKTAFKSYAEYWLETFRLGGYSADELLRMVEPVGDSVKVIEDGFAEGRGILVITPHLGFYDMGVAWVGAMGWRATTVAEVLRPKALFEWFVRIRQGKGVNVLPARNRKWVGEKLAAVLDKGEMVALVADRDLGRRGIWVEFFGEATTFPVSPAMLLVQKQVPLIAAAITRHGKSFHMYFERVPYELTGDNDADVRGVAQVTAVALEKMVRRAPEQWHMFSTNWPAEEAHLPPRGRKSDVLPQIAPLPKQPSPAPGSGEPAPAEAAAEEPTPLPSPAEQAATTSPPSGAAPHAELGVGEASIADTPAGGTPPTESVPQESPAE